MSRTFNCTNLKNNLLLFVVANYGRDKTTITTVFFVAALNLKMFCKTVLVTSWDVTYWIIRGKSCATCAAARDVPSTNAQKKLLNIFSRC